MVEIKCENMKNLLIGVDKIEQLVAIHLQLFYWYGLEDLQTCQSQYSTEGPLEGDSLMSFLQTNCEEQRWRSTQGGTQLPYK